MQKIILANCDKDITDELSNYSNNILIVCDKFCVNLPLYRTIISHFDQVYVFCEFSSNPKYEEVVAGVKIFSDNNCQSVIALGGGSAIDVAKCIKLFATLGSTDDFLSCSFIDSEIPLTAIPTTAGTGSESTKYAVIYKDGIKQSVTHESLIPNTAILYPELLFTLPQYQKKCTVLDALCQAIESWWSVNSTEESKVYAKTAVETIIKNYRKYVFDEDFESSKNIMVASNYAGRAINITQTTAPHAMSYKLTTLYGLPHGYAVAICLPQVWQYMTENMRLCSDARGIEYLKNVFNDIATAMGVLSSDTAIKKFITVLNEFDLSLSVKGDRQIVEHLADSVNHTRLKNNPVLLERNAILSIYGNIVELS